MLWSLMERTTFGVDGNGGSNVTWGSRGLTVPTSTMEGWNCCADAIVGTMRPITAKNIPGRIVARVGCLYTPIIQQRN